jgi:hypothetical protein
MSGLKDAEQELEKVEKVLAMADRVIQLSRQVQERLSSDLTAAAPEQVQLNTPAVDLT